MVTSSVISVKTVRQDYLLFNLAISGIKIYIILNENLKNSDPDFEVGGEG